MSLVKNVVTTQPKVSWNENRSHTLSLSYVSPSLSGMYIPLTEAKIRPVLSLVLLETEFHC